ncbi:hypothetical protein ACLOJK_029636 [Asimina triloba]
MDRFCTRTTPFNSGGSRSFGQWGKFDMGWEPWKNEGAEGGSLPKKARTFYSNIVLWDDVTQRVKGIKLGLDQIAKEKNYYGFREHYCPPQGGRSTVDDFETSSLVDESKIIGWEVDKGNVIGRLVSGTNQEDGGVDVFSIIGIGGMGKTMLARSMSQDERAKQHLEMVLWVCVSDDLDVKRIMKAIPLQKKLLETLQGKRFLLILDDIWNEDEEKREKLLLPLQRGAQGSGILITTRSKKIATMMNAISVCELKGLSDEDSWSLFSSKAFGKRKVENQLQLEEIGKEIANKCSGVPLSLKSGRREREDIAEEYFDDLVAQSMFRDLSTNCFGSITSKMHDLLRDLAEFITEDKSRIFEIGNSDASCSMKVRHAAMIVGSHAMLQKVYVK